MVAKKVVFSDTAPKLRRTRGTSVPTMEGAIARLAEAGKPRKSKTEEFPVETVKVNSSVWTTALKLAQGNPRRIEILAHNKVAVVTTHTAPRRVFDLAKEIEEIEVVEEAPAKKNGPLGKWHTPEGEAMIRDAVAGAQTLQGVLRNLGLVCAGGSTKNIRRHIDRLELDVSHFTSRLKPLS